MKIFPFYIYIFFIGVAVSQAIYYYPMMPDPMATHFGFGGKANGWMSKDGFFVFETVIFLITSLSFIVMPWLFQKFKVRKSINLPNRDYWLAPERIDAFYEYFRESFGWFGVATLTLLIGVLQLTFTANLQADPVLDNNIFLIIFIGYLLFVTIWLITFIRKFGKVE